MGKESIYLYIYIFIHKCAIFNSYDKLTEGIRKVVCSNNIQTGQSLVIDPGLLWSPVNQTWQWKISSTLIDHFTHRNWWFCRSYFELLESDMDDPLCNPFSCLKDASLHCFAPGPRFFKKRPWRGLSLESVSCKCWSFLPHPPKECATTVQYIYIYAHPYTYVCVYII